MYKTQLKTSQLGLPAWRSPALGSDPVLAATGLELTGEDINEIGATK